jgi:hypothetical protein
MGPMAISLLVPHNVSQSPSRVIISATVLTRTLPPWMRVRDGCGCCAEPCRPWPSRLLIADDKTVLLDMGHDGKFSAKSASWEENKVILPGDEIVIRVDGGRWFIVKRPRRAR